MLARRASQVRGASAALEHLYETANQSSDAYFLRRQHVERGSAEGMVDAAVGCFKGQPAG